MRYTTVRFAKLFLAIAKVVSAIIVSRSTAHDYIGMW